MKKIVIVVPHMKMGGVQKALISMVNALSCEEYEITLLLENKEGNLLYQLPQWIKIEEILELNIFNKLNSISIIKRYLDKLDIKSAWNYLKSLIKYKLTKNEVIFNINKVNMLSNMEEEFDIAISYGTPISMSVFYTPLNIKAKRKILWIHGDVKQCGVDIKRYISVYKLYDDIYGVSKYAINQFNDEFPQLKNKCKVFYNIIDKKSIECLANEKSEINLSTKFINIVSVGRLGYEKGFDIAIDTLKLLHSKGYKIKWYVCGDGPEKDILLEKIKHSSLENYFILLGDISNPFPYVKNADIYVQPSRHEGYCISLAEARCLGKAIVTTDFPAAKEQIIDNETGIIVKCDYKSIYYGIERIINDNKLREKIEKNLKRMKINKSKIVI